MFTEMLDHRYYLASGNLSERSTIESTNPNNMLGENQRLTSQKRKANPTEEPPRKWQRCSSEVQGVSMMVKGTKIKAVTDKETPKKERTGENGNDTGTCEADKVYVEIISETGRKVEACGCDSSQSSSSSNQNTWSTLLSGKTSRVDFENKYLQLHKLGQGGFGSVYAGFRNADHLPVAIKHIHQSKVQKTGVVIDGIICFIPLEVDLMVRASGGPGMLSCSAAISLLDWYDLDQEVILVMERPDPSVDLLTYREKNGGSLDDDVAKIIMNQLVLAAKEIQRNGVFHRDLKLENTLVQTSSHSLQVWLIDFGCSCLWRDEPLSSFAGTAQFFPPEYFLMNTYEAGPTTVWQLGLILYELMEGTDQFDTHLFMHGITRMPSGLSEGCQDLLSRCLAMDPRDRITLEQMLLHPWFTQSCATTEAI